MNTLQKYLLLTLLLLPAIMTHAQSDLNIEKIFNNYGKQEGSILIELGNDVLGGHTQINTYKSLITASDPKVIEVTEKALETDVERGSKLLESIKDGKLETGYYFLRKNNDTYEHEYILFKNKSKKMTLIYLKGTFPPEQLEKELNKLKDLFIKVNNKRIKLQ